MSFKNVPDPVRVVRVVPVREDPSDVFRPADGGNLGPLRIVVADDSVLFREGVARLLIDNGFVVSGQVGDGEALLELVEHETLDLVLTDIRMPPTHTTEGLWRPSGSGRTP
jgi:AmiR/NasT family two-component response regulator